MEIIQHPTDELLVAEFMSGNDKAFDVLLQRHKDKLYTYILYIVKNNDLADDVFQETFVKAIMQMRQGKYEHNGKFGAWIMRIAHNLLVLVGTVSIEKNEMLSKLLQREGIAHNLLIDVFRTEKSNQFIYDEEAEKAWMDQAARSTNSFENEESEEVMFKKLQIMINQLPVNQREVVNMYYYQDMSFKEIAAATSVSINTALGRMHYAMNNLRKMAEKNRLQQ